MSVSLKEAIETAGYDLSLAEDAAWLLSKRSEFSRLCEQAENIVDASKKHNQYDEKHRLRCDSCRRSYEDLYKDCADDAYNEDYEEDYGE